MDLGKGREVGELPGKVPVLDHHFHTGPGVPDVASLAERDGLPVDVGPEAHTLDQPFDGDEVHGDRFGWVEMVREGGPGFWLNSFP